MIPSDHTQTSNSDTPSPLAHTLNRAYRSGSVPPRIDDAIVQAAHERRASPARRRRLLVLRPARARLTALVTAAALVVAGSAFYLHPGSVTPVSAATVMKRAVSAGLVPNQVSHFTYRLTSSAGDVETSNVWIAAGANGGPTTLALDITSSPGGATIERLVESESSFQIYDARSNTVAASPQDASGQPWSAMISGAHIAIKFEGASGQQSASQKGPLGSMTQGTLDGVAVYVLGDTPSAGDTFYIDAQTYVLRGADWTQAGVTWQARLANEQTMAPSAAPADAFSLNAPPDASAVLSLKDETVFSVDIDGAIAAACHTTTEAYTQAMAQGGTDLLAVCRQTNPWITRDHLIAAVTANVKSQLDAAVAVGKLTADEASAELANIQAKIQSIVGTS